MDKRKFLKVSGIVAAGAMVSPMMSCGNPEEKKATASKTPEPETNAGMVFTQAALGYDYAALEPHIDARTMEIHYSKHHAGYVRKLNNALKEAPNFKYTDLSNLLSEVSAEQTGIRNNGGGHFNHSLYWKCMTPGSDAAPEGKLAEAINSAFGSFEDFGTQFSAAAKTRFGSGWAWLSADKSGKLFISSTPNQDNPLMSKIVKDTGTPVLGIDVWEHAYYLKYQNMRGDYIKAFMNSINWAEVAKNFSMV